MLKRIRLENFKSWRELDIDLAPLTLLFGTNSSGKSSVLQALLLLLQSIERESINFGGGKNDYVNLGSFRDVVYKHNDKQKIKISYWHKSPYKRLDKEETTAIQEENGVVSSNIDPIAQDTLFDFEVNDPGLHYLGPIRQNAQRSYLWSGAAPRRIAMDGENTVAAIIASKKKGQSLSPDIAHWMQQMGLVNQFKVAPIDNGDRFYETRVKIGDTESSLLDVGFGVSQVLPVITLMFFAPEGSIVLLEQPELHLHPSAQAVLGDLFLHVAEKRNLQLIIESHSEHLLRRLQRRIAESDHAFANPDNIKAYFCDKGEAGSTIREVEVDRFGQINNWPDNFFGDITGDLEAMTFAAIEKARNGNLGD